MEAETIERTCDKVCTEGGRDIMAIEEVLADVENFQRAMITSKQPEILKVGPLKKKARYLGIDIHRMLKANVVTIIQNYFIDKLFELSGEDGVQLYFQAPIFQQATQDIMCDRIECPNEDFAEAAEVNESACKRVHKKPLTNDVSA